MELPCANGALRMQTEELGVGWLEDGQLSAAYRAQKNSLGSISTFILSTQDLLPASVVEGVEGHPGSRDDCPGLLSRSLWLLEKL